MLTLDSVPPEELPSVEQEIAGQARRAILRLRWRNIRPALPLQGERGRRRRGFRRPVAARPVCRKGREAGPVTSAASAVPFASPMDGLAFALQAYTGEGHVSFCHERRGRRILQHRRRRQEHGQGCRRQPQYRLPEPLQTPAGSHQRSPDPGRSPPAWWRTWTTSTPRSPASRSRPRASRPPSLPPAISRLTCPTAREELTKCCVDLHKDMVEQALLNRMETVKAIGELVASLFNPAK